VASDPVDLESPRVNYYSGPAGPFFYDVRPLDCYAFVWVLAFSLPALGWHRRAKEQDSVHFLLILHCGRLGGYGLMAYLAVG